MAADAERLVEYLDAGDRRSPLGPPLTVGEHFPNALRRCVDVRRDLEVSHVRSRILWSRHRTGVVRRSANAKRAKVGEVGLPRFQGKLARRESSRDGHECPSEITVIISQRRND